MGVVSEGSAFVFSQLSHEFVILSEALFSGVEGPAFAMPA
jgi:hypothetical protein